MIVNVVDWDLTLLLKDVLIEPSLGVAVIHSKPIESMIEILSPTEGTLEETVMAKPFGIYSSDTLLFLRELAEAIFDDKKSRKFPDVMAFALWCREIASPKIDTENSHRQGRGLIFHVTPGNVPINFAYSLVAGLLSGNVNVVRLPSKKFEQVEFLLEKINEILKTDEHLALENRFILVRYARDKSINDYISGFCDVRIIWGGNQSILDVRQSKIPPRSTEITFADRYSICAIDSKNYMASLEKTKIAQGFYNDTYLFDQNACTAPHLIIWVGDKEISKEASRVFWSELETLASKRYSIEPIQIIDKLVAAARFSAENPMAKLIKSPDNKVFRFEIEEMSLNLDEYKSHSGLFFEVKIGNLNGLEEFVGSNFQTMTQFGFELVELNEFVGGAKLRGIDRVVPIGKSLDFSLVWDGHDLISALSREITISF